MGSACGKGGGEAEESVAGFVGGSCVMQKLGTGWEERERLK